MEKKQGGAAASSRENALHLEESTGVVLLDDLQAVLHQARGLTQLHRTVGDLIPNHLEGKEESDRCGTVDK